MNARRVWEHHALEKKIRKVSGTQNLCCVGLSSFYMLFSVLPGLSMDSSSLSERVKLEM